MIVGYSISRYYCTSPCVASTFDAWFANHYQLIISSGSDDLTPYLSPGQMWPSYIDGCCIDGYQIYRFIYGIAATHGWADPEGPLLHMRADYAVTQPFSGIDQFDSYEQPRNTGGNFGNPLLAANGVFTLARVLGGDHYTDVTVQAYCPATSCSSYHPNPVSIVDRLLVGYQIPFDMMNVTINTGRTGGAVTYAYWDGNSYSSLTPVSDTTNGLARTGTLSFLPPSNWMPHMENGSQSKYWIEVIITGKPSRYPIIGRLYGDNLLTTCSYGSKLCARGWNPSACVSRHINIGTPVEYCGTPSSGATARFRQQARALGYGSTPNDFFGNPGNRQGGQFTWPYVELARTEAILATKPSGQNGIMLDNADITPTQIPAFSGANSDLGYSTILAVDTMMYPAMHTVFTNYYGASPKWWDGENANMFPTHSAVWPTMNWLASEANDQTGYSYTMDTKSPLFLCTTALWCPGSPTNNNPLGTIEAFQIQDGVQFSLWDGNGSTTDLTRYHLWDKAQRTPMLALAMYYMVKNPNILFGYNPAGMVYSGTDEYYYWVVSARTIAAPGLSPSTCRPTACTIPLSGSLEASACPGALAYSCPLRIGGVDVVGATSYVGTTLTTQIGNGYDTILHSYSAGATVEYMMKGHNSVSPIQTPIAMYGYYVPASSVNLGTPDATYGFDKPCTSSSSKIDGGCVALSGPAATGNSACAPYNCSPLLRRDFTGGDYGNATVLMRPVASTNTATTEYETYGTAYALPGTYYELMADGTVNSSPVTSVTLRGGEAGIYVSELPGR